MVLFCNRRAVSTSVLLIAADMDAAGSKLYRGFREAFTTSTRTEM